MTDKGNIFRSLPSVDKLLKEETIAESAETVPHVVVIRAIRDTVESIRQLIHSGTIEKEVNRKDVVSACCDSLNYLCTGRITKHNNELSSVLKDSLWLDRRFNTLVSLLTGTEGAIPVQNVSSALKSMYCSTKSLIVIPSTCLIYLENYGYVEEMILKSGLSFIECGCTNRYHIKDLERVIETSKDTVAGLVYSTRPNVKTLGFKTEPEIEELAKLCKKKKMIFSVLCWNGEPSYFLNHGADYVVSPVDYQIPDAHECLLFGKTQLLESLKCTPLLDKEIVPVEKRANLEKIIYEKIKTSLH